MDDYTLHNGFHPLDKEDLSRLLPKIETLAACKVFFAYLCLPVSEQSTDPKSEYISAISKTTVQDLMDTTGLSKPSVVDGRKRLVELGQLERISGRTYRIPRYKKVKSFNFLGEDYSTKKLNLLTFPNVDDPKKLKDLTSSDTGDSKKLKPLTIEDDDESSDKTKKLKPLTKKLKPLTFDNGGQANGSAGLSPKSGLLRKNKEEDLILLLLEEYKKRVVDHIGIEDEAKLDQYCRWLKTGIGADGKLNMGKMIDNSRPGRVIHWENPDHKEMVDFLLNKAIVHILDGLWSAKENNISASSWLTWVFNHVDQWEYRHKDDPKVLEAQADEKKREYQSQKELSQKRAGITNLLGDDYTASEADQLVVEKLVELEKEEIIALVKKYREEKQTKRLMEYLHMILIESEVADVE